MEDVTDRAERCPDLASPITAVAIVRFLDVLGEGRERVRLSEVIDLLIFAPIIRLVWSAFSSESPA